MEDPNKLLEGPVEDVKTRIEGLSHDDLLKVREAEADGQKRADVLLVLEAAIAAAETARAGGVVQMTPSEPARVTMDDTHRPAAAAVHETIAADLDTSDDANIAPATTFSTSGAPAQIVPDVDPSHPAVDNNPRERTTAQMNRIDFNDPTLSGPEAAAQMLAKQKQA